MVTNGILKKLRNTCRGKCIWGSKQLSDLVNNLGVQTQCGEKMGNGIAASLARDKILSNNRIENKLNVNVYTTT